MRFEIYRPRRRLVVVDELQVVGSGKVDKKRPRAEVAGD
jgi:hypothetical protein